MGKGKRTDKTRFLIQKNTAWRSVRIVREKVIHSKTVMVPMSGQDVAVAGLS